MTTPKAKKENEDTIMMKSTRVLNVRRKEHAINVDEKKMIMKRILNVRGMTPRRKASHQMKNRNIQGIVIHLLKTFQGHLARNVEAERMKDLNKEDTDMTQNRYFTLFCVSIFTSYLINSEINSSAFSYF